MSARVLLMLGVLLAGSSTVSAGPGPAPGPVANPVADWATIVQTAIHNAAAPRSAGTSQILHTMIVLAMYDAVVGVEGDYRPFATKIRSPHGTDLGAAVATAAYLTARARVAASQYAYLDQQYAAYMAAIADSSAKSDGVRVGELASAAILTLRADDGFSNVVLYECSAMPTPVGEFEPDAGCPTAPTSPQPVDVKVGRIRPFTYADARWFRPAGPVRLTSRAYAQDFAETRDYGRVDSTIRTAGQTDVAYFWSEHPYVHWNRNLIALARSRDLSAAETARFFAMVHTSASDSLIAGFNAKYHFVAWRPRTAIPRADTDGNPATDFDPTWRPLLLVNHPEYPSGHGFWSTAVLEAIAAFFGTHKVSLTLTTSKTAVPPLVQTERTYERLDDVLREVFDARVWGGLHWRFSMRDGSRIGHHVASHVTRHYFRPVKDRR